VPSIIQNEKKKITLIKDNKLPEIHPTALKKAYFSEICGKS
jgi:hypothetical protein